MGRRTVDSWRPCESISTIWSVKSSWYLHACKGVQHTNTLTLNSQRGIKWLIRNIIRLLRWLPLLCISVMFSLDKFTWTSTSWFWSVHLKSPDRFSSWEFDDKLWQRFLNWFHQHVKTKVVLVWIEDEISSECVYDVWKILMFLSLIRRSTKRLVCSMAYNTHWIEWFD